MLGDLLAIVNDLWIILNDTLWLFLGVPMFFTVFMSIVLTIIVLFCLFGIVIVKQQTCVIIERLGRFSAVLEPGFHLIIPVIDRASRPISMRIVQLDLDVDTKTKDNVFVNMPVAVQYCVDPDKVKDAYYKLKDPEDQIKAYVFDIVRAEVPEKDLDDLFTSKDDISKAVQTALQQTMTDFGFVIKRSLITDITPDRRVMEAMNSINAAKREQEAAKHIAEAKKIKMVAEAEAEAESKRLQGEGTANQRKALAKGIADSVECLKTAGISEREANAILLATQYFDMQQSLGQNSKSNTIFTPLTPCGGGQIMQDILSGLSAFNNKED